jgi:predicted ester cyclase
MAENAELIRGLMEAFNRRDFDYIRERTGPDSVLTDVGSGETWTGPDEGHRYNTMWADAFPDGKITIDRIIEAGDTVVLEYTGNGTHTGDMVTSRGTIPATGKKVTLHFCDLFEVKGGKVHSQRTYGDSGALMAQLGLTTAQPTAAQ